MAVAKVQAATGNGATVVLNGCVSGNALILQTSYFRSVPTSVAEALATDSNGTFVVSNAVAPAAFGTNEIGASIFHQQNIAAGTHTVTPQANTEHYQSLTEFSGLSPTALFAAGSSNSGKMTNVAGGVALATGTTSTAASAGDLAVINCGLAGNSGVANVGWTDPVSGYTTSLKNNDDQSSIGALQGFQVLGSGGTQTATFNWTDAVSTNSAHAVIATFVQQAAVDNTTKPCSLGNFDTDFCTEGWF